jgi:hypothetical protein
VYKTETFEPFEMYNRLRGSQGKNVPMGLINIDNRRSMLQRVSLYVRANCFIPDARKGWNRYAIGKAEELLQSEKFDAMITTGPPHSSHLIGLEIRKRHGLKWVADFRDPWTNIYYNKILPRTAKTERKDRYLEDAVVKAADHLVVVSKGLRDEFKDRAQRIRVICNGFDSTDIKITGPAETAKFTLSYIGNLKPNQNAVMLWRVLGKLVHQDDRMKQYFELSLTGNIDGAAIETIRNCGLEKHFSVNGYINHLKATRKMSSSNLLLFIIPMADSNRLILTGKLFEYLASCVPMLSIGPVDGNAAEIISAAGRDTMLDYQDTEGMTLQLKKYFEKWLIDEKKQTKFYIEPVMKFSRKELT